MTVIAIDTASRRRGLCVLAREDGTLVESQALTSARLDSELPLALAPLVAAAADLRAVVCVMGPGSFTGLRVGIAAALGLAHALDLPLHGTGALDVVALAAPPDAPLVEAVADAGRGGIYVAAYRRDGDALTALAAPARLERAAWQPRHDAVAVSLDGVPGTRDAAAGAAEALAAATRRALATDPLPRAGLEPVYLSGHRLAAPEPRV